MKAHLDRQAAGVLPDDDDGHLIFKKNDTLHGRCLFLSSFVFPNLCSLLFLSYTLHLEVLISILYIKFLSCFRGASRGAWRRNIWKGRESIRQAGLSHKKIVIDGCTKTFCSER